MTFTPVSPRCCTTISVGPFWDDETEEAIEMWCCDADRLIRELGLTEFRVEHPVAERWWATKVEPIDD